MNAPYVNADMSVEDRVWEPREVSLPHWIWEQLDEFVEEHGGHKRCQMQTTDLAMAAFVTKVLSLSMPTQLEYAFVTRAWWEAQLDAITASASNRPLCDIDEYMRIKHHLVEEAHQVVGQNSDRLVAHALVELMLQVLYSRGVRLTLNEDLHTVMVGAHTPEQTKEVHAAAERLGIADRLVGGDDDGEEEATDEG